MEKEILRELISQAIIKVERMEKLSEHFSWAEANCKDGTPVPIELHNNAIEVANQIEVLRFALGGIPIHVNSWYRTKEYNKSIGGAKQSQHLLAKATDIWVTGLTPVTIYTLIEALIRLGKMKQGGLGLYNTFCHYDIRGDISRWDLRT